MAVYDNIDREYNKRMFTVNDTYGLDFATKDTVNPIVQNMRNLGYAGVEGSLPMWAPDGTNCTRSIGLAMQGTPYEGVANIKELNAISDYYGDKIHPKDAGYEWEPGDIEVWNGGEHAIMRTENGGRIQAGVSVNGIHETDNPNDRFGYKGAPDYVIRTSKYTPSGNAQTRDEAIRKVYGDPYNLEGYRYKGYTREDVPPINETDIPDVIKQRINDFREKNFERYNDYEDANRRQGLRHGLGVTLSKWYNDDPRERLQRLYREYIENGGMD